jgi:hypothetical protein
VRAFRTQFSTPGEPLRSTGVVAGDISPDDEDDEDLLMLWDIADSLIP